MISNTFVLIIILTLIVCFNCQTTYSASFDAYRTNKPSYSLGFINNGTTIMVNFTTPSTVYDFSGSFIREIQTDQLTNAANVTCNVVTGCNAGEKFCTIQCPIVSSNFYRVKARLGSLPIINNIPILDSLQIFYMTVSQYDTNYGGYSNSSASIKIRYKATETFRRQLNRLIYNQDKKKFSFSLYPVQPNGVNPDLNKADLYMWKVNSIQDANSLYDINGQPEMLSDVALFTQGYNSTTQNLTYTSISPLDVGFYVLMTKYKQSNKAHFARVIFPSDQYACPYNPEFADYYQNFQPCLGSQNSDINTQSPGFPCVNFDNSSLTCLGCFTGYQLVNGSCIFNDTCPDRFYFHFGECYPISQACLTYDRFTGVCLRCVSNTNELINGSCLEPTVTCGARQVVINNICVDVSANCNDFNSLNGLCTSCISGFDIQSNGTCTPSILNCPSTQYAQNGICVDIPANCISFDRTILRCTICSRGYWLSNVFVCQRTICPQGKVPSAHGAFCVDVSPLCGVYDDLIGGCLTCRLQDHTVINGECQGVSSPLAGCEQRERLGFGECVNSQANCEIYNLQTGNCQTCLSPWVKDYTGRCTLKNTLCQADQVAVQGICMQKPANCLALNSFGMCSQCSSAGYKLQDGQCVLIRTCENNQYQTSTGVCVDVVSGCSFYNPTSGVCLRCSNESEAINGLCCSAGQHAYEGSCIDDLTYRSIVLGSDQSQTPTCLSYHPTMGYCLACNGNFVPSTINPQICI